jgi:hypothetical protein
MLNVKPLVALLEAKAPTGNWSLLLDKHTINPDMHLFDLMPLLGLVRVGWIKEAKTLYGIFANGEIISHDSFELIFQAAKEREFKAGNDKTINIDDPEVIYWFTIPAEHNASEILAAIHNNWQAEK